MLPVRWEELLRVTGRSLDRATVLCQGAQAPQVGILATPLRSSLSANAEMSGLPF